MGMKMWPWIYFIFFIVYPDEYECWQRVQQKDYQHTQVSKGGMTQNKVADWGQENGEAAGAGEVSWANWKHLSRVGKSFLYQFEGKGRQIRDKSQRSYREDYI